MYRVWTARHQVAQPFTVLDPSHLNLRDRLEVSNWPTRISETHEPSDGDVILPHHPVPKTPFDLLLPGGSAALLFLWVLLFLFLLLWVVTLSFCCSFWVTQRLVCGWCCFPPSFFGVVLLSPPSFWEVHLFSPPYYGRSCVFLCSGGAAVIPTSLA